MTDPRKEVKDDRGTLVVNSIPQHIPAFPVRRFFMITGKEGKVRGYHAHKTCWQIIIIISGAWKINQETFKGLRMGEYNPEPLEHFIVEPGTWIELEALSDDAQLLVLCDKEYDPADYIHDRKEFEELCRRQQP